MKPSPTEPADHKLLILSDGKPGHLNQSIAFARHLGWGYDICRVGFRSRPAKALSYLFDRCGLVSRGLFHSEPVTGAYRAVVSAGSATYYANRVVSRQLGCRSVAIMLPRGYRYNFDLIVAQQHDRPPVRDNLLSLPVNLGFVEPQGVVKPADDRSYVAVIIGGDSRRGRLDAERLRNQLARIFAQFAGCGFWLTTSRRTSPEVEGMLRRFNWDRAVYVSQEQLNPIPDYLRYSAQVFLTADSTSMISEAVSYGSACVEVLPGRDTGTAASKVDRMISALVDRGAVHLYDGEPGAARHKIDLAALLRPAAAAVNLLPNGNFSP